MSNKLQALEALEKAVREADQGKYSMQVYDALRGLNALKERPILMLPNAAVPLPNLDTNFVIYSASEDAPSQGGYWSNIDGWGALENASIYTQTEKEDFHLPVSANSDAGWMSLAQAYLQPNSYIASGGTRCPHCGSEELSADQLQSDAGQAWGEVSCDDCGKSWTDQFALVGFNPTSSN